jgi:hypothetical protein
LTRLVVAAAAVTTLAWGCEGDLPADDVLQLGEEGTASIDGIAWAPVTLRPAGDLALLWVIKAGGAPVAATSALLKRTTRAVTFSATGLAPGPYFICVQTSGAKDYRSCYPRGVCSPQGAPFDLAADQHLHIELSLDDISTDSSSPCP